MMSKVSLVVLCVAAGCATGSAQTGQLSSADKSFLKSTATTDMTEAHLGKMAQDQASDDAVKTFGRTLIEDHTKAYEDLTVLASKIGDSIPKGIDVRRNPAIQELKRDKGAAFDRRFVRQEVLDQQKTVAEFKHESEKGQNPDVKAYAQKMIPVVEQHLHKAEELEKSERQTASVSPHR